MDSEQGWIDAAKRGDAGLPLARARDADLDIGLDAVRYRGGVVVVGVQQHRREAIFRDAADDVVGAQLARDERSGRGDDVRIGHVAGQQAWLPRREREHAVGARCAGQLLFETHVEIPELMQP